MINPTSKCRLRHSRLMAGALALVLPTSGQADSGCEIITSVAEYYERREEAIILMQYKDLVVRATGGDIRCAEDTDEGRQVCMVDGQGEILVEGAERSAKILRLTSGEMGEVHIYPSGNLSCGLKAEFDRNR